VRAWQKVLAVVAVATCAGCASNPPEQSGSPSTETASGSALQTHVVSVSSTSTLSEMVRWNATNPTGQTQLATCEVLVLHGSTQLGDSGPLQIAVAAGATAEQFSEVTTLAGSNAGDRAQIACQSEFSAQQPAG
jgi:hypothetical protein